MGDTLTVKGRGGGALMGNGYPLQCEFYHLSKFAFRVD